MKKLGITVVLIALLVMMIAACASTNEASEQSSPGPTGQSATVEPSPSESAATEDATASADAVFPRTVESAGEPVTIERKPLKVGLASWQLVEMLFPFDQPSVGITLPFAAANSALESDVYKPYVDKFNELIVIGENTKVNLEVLLAYEPDIIVAGSITNQEIKDQLEQIAPTVWIDEEKIQIRNEWPKVVELIGNILGQEERANEVIENFAAKQREGKEMLSARSGETVLFVQVREKAVYMMGADTLTRYYEGLGLTSPEAKELPVSAQLTLEGLSEINPDHLFLGHFNYTTKAAALTDEWESSEVWKSLKAVQNNQVYSLNGELALGLGPIGQAYGLDTVVEAMK